MTNHSAASPVKKRHEWLTSRLLVTITSFLAVFAIGLTACNNSEPTELRLGINPWPGYGYFAVAKEQGFLDGDNAVNLDILETSSLSDSLRAFERGQVDLIGGTLAELADINAHGRRSARAILILNRSLGGDMIVSTETVQTVPDLADKRVALEPGSVNVVVLAAAGSAFGLDVESIDLVALPQGEMREALATREIDAAITYSPSAETLLALDGVHRLFDTRAAPNAVVDVLIASEEVVEEKPEALVRLIAGHERAVQWSRENPERATRLMAKNAGQTFEEAVEAHGAIEMLTLDEQSAHWVEDGELERAMLGTTDILALIHDHPAPDHATIKQVLNSRFVQEAKTP